MIKRILSQFDLQDLQLVTGIALLGYGLHLVYPPAAFIGLGSLFISPIILPPLVALWRSK